MKRFGFLALAFAAILSLSAVQAQSPVLPGPGLPVASAPAGMVTPFIGSSGTSPPSTTVINYTYPANGNAALIFSATNSSVGGGPQALMAAAGVHSGLSVNMPVALAAATSYTVAVVKNSVIQTEQCVVTNAALTCTDAVNTVTFAAGDFLSYAVCPGTISGTTCTPGTAPNSQTSGVQISALFTSTTPGESPTFGSIGGNNFTTGTFATWGIWGAPSTATEANASALWPTGGVLSNFFINTQVAPGTGSNSHVFTLQQNGSPTAITCTIASSASLTACSDTTHSITIAPGDTISVGYAIGLGAPAGPGHVSFAAKWVPTIPGEAVIFSHGDSGGGIPGTTTNSFEYFNGRPTGSSETAQVFQIVPVAMTLKKLNWAFTPVPGGTASRSIVLRHGNGTQSSTLVTCTAGSAALGCSDTTDSYGATQGEFLNYNTTVANAPTAYTKWAVGIVMTVP